MKNRRRVRVANAPRLPFSCAGCLVRPVDTFNTVADRMFCSGCDELIHDGEVITVDNRGVAVYKTTTQRAADWQAEGHEVFDSTYRA